SDGKLDIVVGGGPGIWVFIGNGNGTFQSPMSFPTANYSACATIADFNNDGKADIAVCDYNLESVSILLGNGDGTFQPYQTYASDYEPLSIAVGDFNGDGNLDLAVASISTSKVSILL